MTIPVHWTVQKNELSIARLRLMLGPKLRKDICAKAASYLRAGNTVQVILYGAANTVLTTFTYTKRDCI